MIQLILTVFFLSLALCNSQQEKTSTTHYYVAELGDLWCFPSDHLPVGAIIGNHHIVLWNILDTKYLHHIEGNSQGLRDSLILQTNIPDPDDPSLTLRESIIIQYIEQMLEHPTHPRSVLALEEMGSAVFNKLQQILPSHFQLIPIDETSGDIFIYDANLFEKLHFERHAYSKKKNTYELLVLKEKQTGVVFNFIQSHVPGGPNSNSQPARKELAHFVMDHYEPDAITIVMGDMNRSPDYFITDFEIASIEKEMEYQPFCNVWIPYPTHINTSMEASWIDNLFIANPFPNIPISVSDEASQFFSELQPTVDLLLGLSNT